MALRQFFSFDAWAQATSGITAANLVQFFPGATAYDPANGGFITGTPAAPTGAAITTGWVRGQWQGYTLAGNGAGGCSCIGLPMSKLSDVTTNASYFGFRYCRNSLSFGPSVSLNSTGGTQVILPAAAIPAGQISYVEFLIDRVNKLLTVWIDGAQYSSAFFDYTSFAASADTTLWFGTPYNYGYPGGGVGYWWMRDFYSLDDTGDSSLCSRLGPVDVRPALLSSVTAPNWVSSDAQTPLIDLNTQFGAAAANWTGPTLTEPTTMDTLTAQFSNANLVAGENILGFKMDVSALRQAGFLFNPTPTIKYNNQTVTGKQLTYPNGNAMVYNQNTFLLEKAPDGSAWTPASLAAAVMTLAP